MRAAFDRLTKTLTHPRRLAGGGWDALATRAAVVSLLPSSVGPSVVIACALATGDYVVSMGTVARFVAP